jgi:hypothetical protein
MTPQDHLTIADRLLRRREPPPGATVRETMPPRAEDVALAQAHATVALTLTIKGLIDRLPEEATA